MSHYTDAYVERQLAAIARVRELHKKCPCGFEDYGYEHCVHCADYYPCKTIKALDGEQ